MLQDKRFLLWLAFGLSWGGVAIALMLQHGFDMQPCAWCNVQRGVYLVVGLLALLALVSPASLASVVLALLAAAFALGGLAAAGFQHFVAAKTDSCGFSWADRMIYEARLDETLPWLFKATASCSEANLPLFGVPFAIWSAALFTLLFVILLRSALRGRPGATTLPVVPQ
ncbi:MAG: disulfide bond formation protein B [Gemmatimonadales bacterium]|jgi:disulfide bond formation protein DsbB|nr:disulfide bond formation protein B [Gemmatimonadales bacterium]